MTIAIPEDRRASVVGVQLSGSACGTGHASCVSGVGQGCNEFAFRGIAIGACAVDVQFDTGSADFETTFSFVRYPCCSGVYAELPSGSTITAPDLPGEAGAAK